MKRFYVLAAATGLVGAVAYAYRDQVLAGMLGLVTKLQGLGEDWTEEEAEEPEEPRTISFPKQEEDLDAR